MQFTTLDYKYQTITNIGITNIRISDRFVKSNDLKRKSDEIKADNFTNIGIF